VARGLVGAGEFVEIHVDTPLAVAEQRDVKGLYAKARRGELANFTGIDSPYEPPENAELTVDTARQSCEQAAELVLEKMRELGLIDD
jgi:bifunctional enzyme CysN/CysC